ncbi:hypothetical protein BJV74DRAFT_796865 [Russula compacta]|nr:hypothetical protein BJV74DRAFT_796865 [Russula compacta]
MDKHVKSRHRDRNHRDTRAFVMDLGAFAIRFTIPLKDLVLEKILDLIRQHCCRSPDLKYITGMHLELTGKMAETEHTETRASFIGCNVLSVQFIQGLAWTGVVRTRHYGLGVKLHQES